MKKLTKPFVLISALIFSIANISGCINIIQKVKINEDGSGIMQIRYWIKFGNNVEDYYGFGFTKDRIKSNYTSHNSEPFDINIENNLSKDNYSVVTLKLKFKDFNYLSTATAFKGINAYFSSGIEGKEFKYIILKDTNVKKDNNELLFKDKILIEFEFPSEVIHTNGEVNGKNNVVIWDCTIADLFEDIEMVAKLK